MSAACTLFAEETLQSGPWGFSASAVEGATTLVLYFPGMNCDGDSAHERLLWRLGNLRKWVTAVTVHAEEEFDHGFEDGTWWRGLGLYQMVDGYSADPQGFGTALARSYLLVEEMLASMPAVTDLVLVGYSLGGPLAAALGDLVSCLTRTHVLLMCTWRLPPGFADVGEGQPPLRALAELNETDHAVDANIAKSTLESTYEVVVHEGGRHSEGWNWLWCFVCAVQWPED